MADNVLKIGALVDVESIGSGMAEAASVVDSATSQMTLNFKELADVSTTSDDAMIAGMATLTEAIATLTTAFQEIPARAVPAIRETEGALSELQERFVGAAETAKLSAAGIGGAFSGIGKLLGVGIAGGFFLHFIDETQEAVLQMDHLSQRTGFTIETIAGLKYAADTVGISMDALSQGMGRLLRAQELATQGGKGQIQALHDIGLSVSQIKDLAPEQLFFTIGEAIAKTTSAADANAAAFALLGRGGGQLIPLFKDYGDQLQVVVDEHGKLSLVTKQAAEAALQYKQVTADLSEGIRSIMIPVMEGAVVVMKGWEDAWVILKATGVDVFLNLQAGAENLATAMMAVTDASIMLVGGQAGEATKIIADAHAQIAANSDVTSKHVEQVWTDAYARMKAIMAKPLDVAAFTAPPQADKLAGDNGQKALLEAQLKEQLAAIDAEKAAQHLAYAEGKIDLDAWIAAQTAADTQAYAAHEAYFTKLKALFANNPTKLAAVGAEQLDYEYKTAAKSTDELATGTEKLNRELVKMGQEAAKAQTKELEKELKDTDKAALELAKSLSDLGKSQRTLNEETKAVGFSDQETAIKDRVRLGLDTESQGAAELKAVYAAEEQDQLSHLNEMVSVARAHMAALTEALAGDPGNKELKTRYNDALAALNTYETQRIQIEQQFNQKSQALNIQMEQQYKQVFDKISSQFNNAVAGWVSGQQTFAQGMMKVWQGLVSDIIGYILKIGERWIFEHVVMAAANKLFHTQDAADEVTAQATKSAANVAVATSEAAVAAGGQFAFYSATDPLIAPEMAAAAYAQGLTFAGLAAFEKGGISEGGLSLLHPKEMVLDPALSSFVQSSAASASGGGGSGGGDTYHTHVHLPPITAMDSTGVAEQMKKITPQLTRTVMRGMRAGHGSLKGLL